MRKIIALNLLALLAVACQKNENNPPAVGVSYFPLNVGNYWVYEQYKIDSLGVETKLDQFDSVAISHDTIINESKYYVQKSFWPQENNPRVTYFRDSSKYLVNNFGKVYFSETNFTDVLNYAEYLSSSTDTLYTLAFKMVEGISSITVPAGIFNVLNCQGTLITHYHYFYSNNNTEIIERKMNKCYSPNIGLVLDTYAWISQRHNVVERRLVRYNIEEE